MYLQVLLRNRHLLAVLVTWSAAQILKPIVYWVINREWDWGWLVTAGGMPSSHSAACSALTVATAMIDGLDSTAFATAFVFSVIVLYDAAGVRRSAGQQAHVLNQILQELFAGRPIAEERLRELIGHTPFEVAVGTMLGAVGSFLVLH